MSGNIPPEIDRLRELLAAARRQSDASGAALDRARAEARAAAQAAAQASREGEPNDPNANASAGEREARAKKALADAERVRDDARSRVREIEDRLHARLTPQDAVGQFSSALPIVLLPVRLEARFLRSEGAPQLWVRIYPDDVAVDSHDPLLTADEEAAGKNYWRSVYRAGSADGVELAQWRLITSRFGVTRSAYIVRYLQPPEPLPAAPAPPGAPPLALTFPSTPPRPDGLPRAPRTSVLPDRFVLMGFEGETETFTAVCQPVPSPLMVGPDPSEPGTVVSRTDGKLAFGPELAWLVDFDEAVRVGMGCRVALTEEQFAKGFDRVVALGVRYTSNAADARQRFEELLESHHYSDGLSLVPQGTPTNNCGAAQAGPAPAGVDVDIAFGAERRAPLFTLHPDPSARPDGERLSAALGIDPGVLQHVLHSDASDWLGSEAMQRALWPATLGYFMTEIMEPVFTDETIDETRSFFTRYVKGRGALPAIRVGRQPYGILPTTVFSRWSESSLLGGATTAQIHTVVRQLHEIWKGLSEDVPRMGGKGDPDDNFLRALGLQASSVEFFARTLVGEDYFTNLALFEGHRGAARMWGFLARLQAALALGALGATFTKKPRLFGLSFFADVVALDGPVVDPAPLSETAPLPEIDPSFGNYIQWLRTSSVDSIRDERFGVDASGQARPAPSSLLYLLLRQALLEAYFHATRQLHLRYRTAAPELLREQELLNIGGQPTVTRWDLMKATIPEVAPGRSLSSVLETPAAVLIPEAEELEEAKSALEILAALPTAQLERLLAEHVDCCNHRLDAWELAFLTRRLESMEGVRESPRGLYLGAYGVLENLRPKPAPAPAAAGPLATRAATAGRFTPTLTTDPSSGGFVHTPSLNHAVAAAVLRSGYMTHASPAQPDTMSVNLTSERVRRALGYVEGLRNGQSLAALLGYQFERGLHDENPALVLDRFILSLRTAFPLASGKLTNPPPGVSIEAIEARNVVDGKRLLQAAKDGSYPYGVTGLPAAGSSEAHAIEAQVDRLADDADALADLGLAESVFQAVQGNFDRSGAVLKAVSEGGPIPDFEFIRTPRGGDGITHRVVIAFDDGADASNPWTAAGVPMTPRARMEPRLNHWLGVRLGDPRDIRCLATAHRAAGDVKATVPLSDLRIQAIDVVSLALRDIGDGASELPRRVELAARALTAAEDTEAVDLEFLARDPSWPISVKTFFESWPLLRALRDVISQSRTLAADDLRRPSDRVAAGMDPKGYDTAELDTRCQALQLELSQTFNELHIRRTAAESAGPPWTAGILAPLRDALFGAALFGFPDSIPRTRVALTDEAAAALIQAAQGAEKELGDRLAQINSALASTSTSPAERVRQLTEGAQAALTASFSVLPRCLPTNGAEIANSLAGQADLLKGAGPLPIPGWLSGLAPVRRGIDRCSTAGALAEAFGAATDPLRVVQLPFVPGSRWRALPFQGPIPPAGDVASLVVDARPAWDPSAPQSGLVVDEWHEVVPAGDVTTGLAFHFDRPNAEPPQAILLAIAPSPTGPWQWSDLVDTIHETLEMARIRAVEPEAVGTTAFAELLPAILIAMTQNMSSITVDLRRNRVSQVAASTSLKIPEDDL